MTTTPTENLSDDPVPTALAGAEIVRDGEESKNEDESKVEAVEEPALDKIAPNTAARTWTFGTGKNEVTYTQRTLSFFQKLETFSVLGDALDRALQGGMSFDTFSQMIPGRDPISPESIMRVASKLIVFSPGMFMDLYCIWLNVPRERRYEAQAIFEVEIDDDAGFAILSTFIDQNGEVLKDFFGERIRTVWKSIATRFSLEGMDLSRLLSDTPPPTESA